MTRPWDDEGDGPQRCPECERPNQFGELCESCHDDGPTLFEYNNDDYDADDEAADEGGYEQ